MILELLIVFLLTLVNGVLAMSELAIVSSRPARLNAMAENGSTGAAIAMRLAEDPGRFLSSVQIGITLVGILSGAFSGATLGVRMSDFLISMGVPIAAANTLGVAGVVMFITYISLVFGELVPKQIALRSPETSAARIAPLLKVISTVFAPVVWLLDKSGKVVLRLLGQSGGSDRGVTDEEVKYVIAEAQSAGVMDHAETKMIAGVMRIADRNARGLMSPRHEVDVVDIKDSPEAIIEAFRTSRRSRLPVRDGTEDELVGVITARDFIDARANSAAVDLRKLMTPAAIVRDGLPALEVIEALRNAPAKMLFVYDEYGHFEGVITPMDVMEGITGEFLDAGETSEPKIVTRDDGSLLVAGWMQVDEFAEHIGLSRDDDRDYETVAGLVLETMGTLPTVGQSVAIQGWRIEVVDMDGLRIDKLLVQKVE